MSKQRKILYVIDSLVTGGAERSLLEIASGLKTYIPTVVVLFNKNPDLKTRFEAAGIELIFLGTNRKYWWMDGALKLKRVIKKIDPTIIHASLFKSEIVTRLAIRKGMPNIGSFVNDSYAPNRYREQTALRNFKLNVVRFFDACTANRVTHFMSISKAISDSNAVALRLDKKDITTIYRGRHKDRYSTDHPGLDGPFIFITVARLIMRKGYVQLFEAAKKLDQAGLDFTIRIAGDGADRQKFVDMVSTLGISKRIDFLGNRTDVPALLADAHCFVFPSHYEGLGGSLVEAMLAARPIIVSDIEVFSEQIDDGKTGLLFKVFDSGDLAEKMKWMMAHYPEGIAMGTEARALAVKRFDIDQVVASHEKLYNDVLDIQDAQ